MGADHFLRCSFWMMLIAVSACSSSSDDEPGAGTNYLTTEIRGTKQPLLDLQQSGKSMRRVYLLSEKLREDPQQVELTRRLTLDETRPTGGLKGSLGLFASDEWWENIDSRKMPLRFVSGTIIRAFEAGQDQEGVNNTVELRLSNGTTEPVGIYLNESKDVALFKPGEYVMVVYALDELKSGIDNLGNNRLEIALEMAVSVE